MALKTAAVTLTVLLLSVQLTQAQADNSGWNKMNFRKNSGQKKSNIGPGLAALIVVSAVNPAVIYENKKIYFGLSRELSFAFGPNGEFRTSFEYSFIFKPSPKHHFRASVKYDVLGKKTKGEFLTSRSFFSAGGGYFADSEGGGIFPEITAGFRLGDGELYLFPYVKLRHTFMLKKNKHDITDFTAGMIIAYQLF